MPTITIREQWAERIKEAFLETPSEAKALLSQNLKEPKTITIVTYQALHSALTRYKGSLSCQAEDEAMLSEDVDFSQFDLAKMMQDIGLGTLCLDECHHLRNEWWKSLEEFRRQFAQISLIALTATPPYDSEPALWQRYMNLCGEKENRVLTKKKVESPLK